jgi:hypothetical protein
MSATSCAAKFAHGINEKKMRSTIDQKDLAGRLHRPGPIAIDALGIPDAVGGRIIDAVCVRNRDRAD